ncbi:MAG: glycoside hydrolase family 32 protein [bacterium]
MNDSIRIHDGATGDVTDDFKMACFDLRERLVADKFRPRYHWVAPFGGWNDLNGLMFHQGRYHLGYLQKIGNGPDKIPFSSWQHISSRDLLHWCFHPASLREPFPGTHGDYFNSGGVIRGTEVPTIIVNMPRKGICIYQCHDDNLDRWVGLPENPVIPIAHERTQQDCQVAPEGARYPECMIFDPSGWKEGETYYALIGSKNFRPGYEGDCTSLFQSKDLRHWEYVGPFYKSDRRWTTIEDDCACSDFFPFGDRHMLVMHSHKPYPKSQYYIGRYEDEHFVPERFGQLSWLGSMHFGPETLEDEKGRRLYWGTVGEATHSRRYCWCNVMTLPWHFIPDSERGLLIAPAEELRSLRYDQRRIPDQSLSAGAEITLQDCDLDCMELQVTFRPANGGVFGLKVLCSPDGEEETTLLYDSAAQEIVIDYNKSSGDESIVYLPYHQRLRPGQLVQRIPYALPTRQPLQLTVYVDRSIIEVFVNGHIATVQRVYPMRADSHQTRIFSRDVDVRISDIVRWKMDATNAY